MDVWASMLCIDLTCSMKLNTSTNEVRNGFQISIAFFLSRVFLSHSPPLIHSRVCTSCSSISISFCAFSDFNVAYSASMISSFVFFRVVVSSRLYEPHSPPSTESHSLP